MGVKQKGFFQWLQTTFGNAVSEINVTDVGKFEAVCIDVNALIHTNMRRAKTEAKFVKALYVDLNRCLRLASAHSVIYLAVDGSPPLAKMREQIKRRKTKSSFNSKKSTLDASCITPGTSFMLRLTGYLHHYAQSYLVKRPYASTLSIIVDGAETAGEGEAKIMQFLSRSAAHLTNRWVAVFSGDSDVIMQAMLSPVPNICVLRTSPEENMAVSIPQLRRRIGQECGGSLEEAGNHHRAIIDFCILVMFSGNDYMRKLRSAPIMKSWPVYKQFRLEALADSVWRHRYMITSHGTLDLAVLREILTRVRRTKHKREFQPNMSLSLSMLGLSMGDPSSGTDTLDDEGNESDGNDSDLLPDPDLPKITAEEKSPHYTKHIPNYLESILWTLSMYSTGTCPDFYFSQIGQILTIEQILTAISRDLVHSRPFTVPYDPSQSVLMTIVSTITLLDAKKADLILEAWKATFISSNLQALSHSLVYDSQVVNERERVKVLVTQMEQGLMSQVDSSSNAVKILTSRQYPIVISGQKYRRPGRTYMPPLLGNDYDGVWNAKIPASTPPVGASTLVILPLEGPDPTFCWSFPYLRPPPKGTEPVYPFSMRQEEAKTRTKSSGADPVSTKPVHIVQGNITTPESKSNRPKAPAKRARGRPRIATIKDHMETPSTNVASISLAQ